MKSRRQSFELCFHKRSKHWVSVHLHSSRAAMRGVLTKLGRKSDDTNACCWQANKPGKDHCVAEMHFGRDYLTLLSIVHECSHAAHHRAVLLGIPADDEEFQEYVAEDTGTLADAFVACLDNKKIPVRYQAAPGRRMI